MAKRLFFPAVFLGFATGEWVEITKLATRNDQDNTQTAPTFETVLAKPQLVPLSPNWINATSNVHNLSQDQSQEEGEENDEEGDNVGTKTMDLKSFIGSVQRQLSSFEGRTLNAKEDHLKKLRDQMVSGIKRRLLTFFDNNEREFRMLDVDHKGSEDHLIDYPSSEATLMTVGFLTFAVFLINLVLRIIFTIRMNNQNFFPPTTTPVSIFLKNSEGNVKEDGSEVQVLRYIDEYIPSNNF